MNVIKNLVKESMYGVKCPYAMNADRIVVHNTANDASARNEIAYMISNGNEVSFHFAVDDMEIIQGIPLNRNAWHAGDGGSGTGNRKGIAIEICYSKSGGERFIKAEKNAAKFIAQLLKERNWSIDKVTKHQDYSGKYCPHRTLDMGWDRFLNMIKAEMNGSGTANSESTPSRKTVDQVAQEVINGAWGNNPARREKLEAAGYDYNAVQSRVNALLGGTTTATPSKKTVDQIAQEVINGAWGNNPARREKLEAAGYDYNAVQSRVNALLGGATTATPSKKTVDQVAQEVINGAWGNNPERRKRLEAAGYDYNAVQSRVNALLG